MIKEDVAVRYWVLLVRDHEKRQSVVRTRNPCQIETSVSPHTLLLAFFSLSVSLDILAGKHFGEILLKKQTCGIIVRKWATCGAWRVKYHGGWYDGCCISITSLTPTHPFFFPPWTLHFILRSRITSEIILRGVSYFSAGFKPGFFFPYLNLQLIRQRVV